MWFKSKFLHIQKVKVKWQYPELAKSDVFWHFLFIFTYTVSNRSRTSAFHFYLYKNSLCTRPQPSYIPNWSWGRHIGLGVEHVDGGMRVILTSLHDILSTSGWSLAKVTRTHQWKNANGQLGCMTLTSFSRSRHDWNCLNWIVLLCILSHYAISEFAPRFLCMYHWDKVKHL